MDVTVFKFSLLGAQRLQSVSINILSDEDISIKMMEILDLAEKGNEGHACAIAMLKKLEKEHPECLVEWHPFNKIGQRFKKRVKKHLLLFD